MAVAGGALASVSLAVSATAAAALTAAPGRDEDKASSLHRLLFAVGRPVHGAGLALLLGALGLAGRRTGALPRPLTTASLASAGVDALAPVVLAVPRRPRSSPPDGSPPSSSSASAGPAWPAARRQAEISRTPSTPCWTPGRPSRPPSTGRWPPRPVWPVRPAERGLRLLEVKAGDTLFVDGGAGGVGAVTVQMALARGARVIASAGEANQDYLREIGAIPMRYGQGLAERVRAAAGGPVDAVFDVAGKTPVQELISLAPEPSQVVSIANLWVPVSRS